MPGSKFIMLNVHLLFICFNYVLLGTAMKKFNQKAIIIDKRGLEHRNGKKSCPITVGILPVTHVSSFSAQCPIF